MKRFFDSSVLVPVFYADHPQHASSAKLFLAAGKDDFCALRTLGEAERLTLITLNEQEYVSALEQASSGTIVGAATYDALIAHCALKAGADTLLTWNVRDS